MSVNNNNSETSFLETNVEAHALAHSNSAYTNSTEADARQIWQIALRDLSHQMDRGEYDAWIKNLSLVRLEQGVALLTAPSTYACRRLQADYAEIVNQALAGVVGKPLTVHFTVEGPVQGQLFETVGAGAANGRTANVSSSRPAPVHGIKSKGPYLDLEHNGHNKSQPPQNRLGNLYSNGNNGNGHNTSRNGNHLNRNSSAYLQRERTLQPAYNYPDENSELEDPITNTNGYRLNEEQDQYEAQAAQFGLNPRYTFDKYIVGSSNRMAEAAAKRVAETPGMSYNPLFVYGQVGLGKTHLLHAIGLEALRLRPYLKVLYVSSERFTNEMVNGIREQRMEDFHSRYRSVDLLMIDDIQFIAGKDQTQEEFFHTFNTLVESGKQVVISSDRPPKSMLTLEDRLRSRFEGGLITDVSLPDYETRLLILRAKAEYQPTNTPISPDVLEFVAHKVPSNIRELEGALIRVVAFGLLNKMPITVELAAQALNDSLINSRKKLVTKERIVEAVATFYNLEVKDLQGKSRSADIVLPRQIAMYIIREQTDHSLVEVGQALGNRDHTTVMHGLDKIEQAIETNIQLRQQINTITQIVYNGESLK